MIRVIYFLFLFCLLGFQVACSPVQFPEQATYTLSDLKGVPEVRASKSHATVLVTEPIADSGYETNAMVYMKTPYELSHYANNRWVAAPANMLQPLFSEALRNTGYFYAVISAPYAGEATYRLTTRVVRFRQEFLLPVSRVRLTVQADMFENASNHLLASERFEAVVPSPANNPYSGVLAANKAALDVSQRIAQLCVHYAKRQR